MLFELHYTWDSVLLSCLGVIALVFLLYKGRPGTEQKTNKEYNLCTDPNCLRCNSNSTYEENLHYEGGIDEDSYPRIRKSFEDGRQRPTVLKLPDLETRPFVDARFYEEDVALLESNYDVIMKEFKEIEQDKSELNGWKTNSTPTGSWSVFCLFNQGSEIHENTSRCPSTAMLIKSLSKYLKNCAFGNACFSVVEPGTVITEHYGPCNVVVCQYLTCGSGLIDSPIEKATGTLRVGRDGIIGLRVNSTWQLHVDNCTASWKQRKCLLFDDSFLHSVNHESNDDVESRSIFMVDLWHYNLATNQISAISNTFPPR